MKCISILFKNSEIKEKHTQHQQEEAKGCTFEPSINKYKRGKIKINDLDNTKISNSNAVTSKQKQISTY